jgi:hypothetical protein
VPRHFQETRFVNKETLFMKKVLWTCVVLAFVALVGVIAAVFLKPYLGNRFHRLMRTAVQEVLDKDAQDIRRRTYCIACEQTAAFVLEKMPNVAAFPDRFALFDYSLESVDPKLNGLYCEFGVWTGDTVNYIASKTNQTVHGFDSFEGLPETWRTGVEKGKFDMSGLLPEVRQNVKLHKGWFEDSLPAWSEQYSGPIAFMHLDADLYSSTKTVLDILGDRIVPGTIIQFDEYFNYPGWQNKGEYKAFMEFVESREVQFEYLSYCYRHEQVSVRILSVGSPEPG